MLRRLSLIVAVVLLLSSSAFAYIHQQQDFAIEAASEAQRSGCIGWAHSLNLECCAHGQRAYNIGHGQLAFQREGAIIGQYAAAWGHCGTSGVDQIALASGHQQQSAADAVIQVIPTPPMASQQQSLNLSLDQDVVKDGGIGGAFGVQGGIATQRQTLVTPNGVGIQVGFVGAIQFGFVGGAPGSDASVTQSVDVTTTQHQCF